MTFPSEISDHHKADLVQKCIYLVAKFKNKDLALWQKYSEQLKTLKVEDSWDFFHVLLVEYQKLADKPDLAAPGKPAVTAPAKKEVAKKAPAKKAAKKAVKKAPAKKAPAKKAAKKVVKKAPAKKVAKKAAKKVVKKAPAKKAAPKKVVKKKAKK